MYQINNLNPGRGGGINSRLEYIDVLRGITMILVVYMHCELYTLGIDTAEGTPLAAILYALRMPMFFFISGFIAYKDISFWNFTNYLKRLSNKSKVQLIPTFVFFIAYYLFIRQIEFPGGYWFTLTLFIIFFIYFSVGLFSNLIKKELLIPILICISLILILLRSKILTIFPYNEYYCLGFVITYLGFFVFGLFFRKHEDLFWKFLNYRGTIAILLIIIVSLFYVLCKKDSIFHIEISKTLYRYILGIPIILVIFNYFYIHRKYWSNNSFISRKLQFIGRRTLDLYMIHNFFLLPSIPKLHELFQEYNNEALIVIVCGSLTCVIVFLCLLISSIIRSSTFLSYWLFGDKSGKRKLNISIRG